MAMLKMDLSFFLGDRRDFFTRSWFRCLHHAVPGVCKGRGFMKSLRQNALADGFVTACTELPVFETDLGV